MLKELRGYDNLGNPEYFWELFCQLRKNSERTLKDINDFFYNKVIGNKNIFDGCIALLVTTNVININPDSQIIGVNYEFKNLITSEQLCSQKLLENFLLKFSTDNDFYNIFSSEHCSHDFIYKSIIIDYSAFGFKYATIRNLLLDFYFLSQHPDFSNKLLINMKYKKFFDKKFLPEIRKRETGIDELKKQLVAQEIIGEEAEKYVLQFELERLNGKEGIEWISPYDTGAGYDIISFENIDSVENDRCIEVKSFHGVPSFYWSRNEMKSAKQKRKRYFLYLYNRKDSSIEIIQDPYENILSSDIRNKEVSNYYITKI